MKTDTGPKQWLQPKHAASPEPPPHRTHARESGVRVRFVQEVPASGARILKYTSPKSFGDGSPVSVHHKRS